ncbi:MAG: hypothetical protein U1E57_10035 [Paenacidovorax caeni]
MPSIFPDGSISVGQTDGRWMYLLTWQPSSRTVGHQEETISPYHIYLNIAYHLSTEARAGLSQFRLPARFEQDLFEFPKALSRLPPGTCIAVAA